MKIRRTLDARGNPVVEVRNRDGIYERRVDQSAIVKLRPDSFALLESAESKRIPQGSTPYGSASVASTKSIRKRSSLDYLRELSEEITRRRDKKDGE